MWGLTEIVVKFIYDEFFQNDSFQFLMSQKDPNANLRSVCYRYEKMANVFFFSSHFMIFYIRRQSFIYLIILVI